MRHRLFAGLLAAGLVLAMSSLAPAEPTPVMRIHVLDVGQGAATLVELPCGVMLVDTGAEESDRFRGTEALTGALSTFFARRADLGGTIDLLVLTHPHIDHVRGAPAVLRTWKVKNLLENGLRPDQEDAEAAMREVRSLAAEQPELRTLEVLVDDLPTDGSPATSPVIDPFPACKGVDPRVEVLWGRVRGDPGWGDDDYGKARFDNANNHSVVTRVSFGKASLLITGDLEAPAIGELLRTRAPASLDSDVYVVGHHGADNGTTRELLDAITPAWAIIQAGPADRRASWSAWAYGHPRVGTLELLQAAVTGSREPQVQPVGTAAKSFTTMQVDRAIYASAWDGTVVLEADAQGQIRRVEP